MSKGSILIKSARAMCHITLIIIPLRPFTLDLTTIVCSRLSVSVQVEQAEKREELVKGDSVVGAGGDVDANDPFSAKQKELTAVTCGQERREEGKARSELESETWVNKPKPAEPHTSSSEDDDEVVADSNRSELESNTWESSPVSRGVAGIKKRKKKKGKGKAI